MMGGGLDGGRRLFESQTSKPVNTSETLARFGITFQAHRASVPQVPLAPAPASTRSLFGVTAALTLAALAWGFVNFGVLLWLPGSLVAEGLEQVLGQDGWCVLVHGTTVGPAGFTTVSPRLHAVRRDAAARSTPGPGVA